MLSVALYCTDRWHDISGSTCNLLLVFPKAFCCCFLSLFFRDLFASLFLRLLFSVSIFFLHITSSFPARYPGEGWRVPTILDTVVTP